MWKPWKRWLSLGLAALLMIGAALNGGTTTAYADEGHTHTEDCYAQEGDLLCGLEEDENHTHGEDCYAKGGELICGLEETPEEQSSQEETEENGTEETGQSGSDADVVDGTDVTGKTDADGTPDESAPSAEETTEAADAPALLAEPAAEQTEASLTDGVNIVRAGAENTVYNIGEGQAVMIASPNGASEPIVFRNCTFVLSGGTVKISGNQEDISYHNGETVTKLFIGGNVRFENCAFETAEGAAKTTSAGYDAAIYFFGGDIQLKDSTLRAEGYNGQFLGLYGSTGAVTFDNCDIATVGNRNGWSYAMYGGSVLKLINGSEMTATGMTIDSGNTNAFYSGDNRTGYDAIFVEDSTIDFSDNQAGGFAINNVNIRVTNSTIRVNNNLGNACNSGYWIVDGSTIEMCGNRGGHGLSCIGFEMTDSTFRVLHNGYAGVYIQSRDSLLTNCTVDLRCNGERLLSYTAGDLWLNGHKLTVDGGTSAAQEGSPWLGGVGRKGAVVTTSGSVVAYDLNSNAADNLKSNTDAVLTDAQLALNGVEDEHTLFLNPFMETAYARGNAESSANNNDADLFADDHVTERADIIGADKAKIGTLTTAQLSHHKYDWKNGKVTDQATETTYGVKRYACTDVCATYTGATAEHPHSFDCAGTYVYAPLVGLAFDGNAGEDPVENLPESQTKIDYRGTGTAPASVPSRSGYIFAGWYADAECTELFDFSTGLTANWTVAYAGWADVSSFSISMSKEATNLNETFKSDVTLSLSTASDQTGLDFVLVDAGSYVEDYMGYAADDYDFDFVNEIDALTLTVGGEALAKTQIAENVYGFGPADGGKDGTTYPFVLTYVRGNGADEEHFTWEINVPVTSGEQVQLTYTVRLTNPQTAEGSYGVYDRFGENGEAGLYTNREAKLYPTDSNGNKGPEQIFNRPTVSYTVEAQEPDIPSTGDSFDGTLWLLLAGAAVIVMAGAGVAAARKKNRV